MLGRELRVGGPRGLRVVKCLTHVDAEVHAEAHQAGDRHRLHSTQIPAHTATSVGRQDSAQTHHAETTYSLPQFFPSKIEHEQACRYHSTEQ